jgi:hypothetical protein
MNGYLIFGLVIIGVFTLIGIIVSLNRYLRRLEFKDWDIDDLIRVSEWKITDRLSKNGKKYAIVKGWTVNNIFLDLGDDSIGKYSWSIVDFNKSVIWRRNFKECESAMGKKPGFNCKVIDDGVELPNSGDMIDGKPIMLLTETECEVYLKQSIDSENYELAEKIKKQMEKYR